MRRRRIRGVTNEKKGGKKKLKFSTRGRPFYLVGYCSFYVKKNAPFDISHGFPEVRSEKSSRKKLQPNCPLTHIQTLSGRF
jgi:hypothetical protein